MKSANLMCLIDRQEIDAYPALRNVLTAVFYTLTGKSQTQLFISLYLDTSWDQQDQNIICLSMAE